MLQISPLAWIGEWRERKELHTLCVWVPLISFAYDTRATMKILCRHFVRLCVCVFSLCDCGRAAKSFFLAVWCVHPQRNEIIYVKLCDVFNKLRVVASSSTLTHNIEAKATNVMLTMLSNVEMTKIKSNYRPLKLRSKCSSLSFSLSLFLVLSLSIFILFFLSSVVVFVSNFLVSLLTKNIEYVICVCGNEKFHFEMSYGWRSEGRNEWNAMRTA